MLFVALPPDIFSLIAHCLSTLDVTRLSQVSKRFYEYVRSDKRLWLECLQRDVISKEIMLPTYLRRLEEASSEDVCSWVRTSIRLFSAYRSGGQNARVISLSMDCTLEATWAKIVRGRWCLIALSNVSTSFIGIWEITRTGSIEFEEKFYLPGPVLDGMVDDDMAEVRIAITVGTKIPIIQILMLGTKNYSTWLVPLQTLRDARHVLLLSSFIIGYKTLRGDDTYPLLTDWRNGATVRLYPAHFRLRPHDLEGDVHTTCQAMGIWRGCIFAVFSYYVEVFPLPSFDVPFAWYVGIQLLYFPMLQVDQDYHWVGEAYIYEAPPPGPPEDMKSNFPRESLLFSIRDRYGCLFKRAISQRRDLSFNWDPAFLDEPKFDVMSYRHCVGASSEYQLRLASEDGGHCHPIFLDLHRSPRSSGENVAKQIFVVSNSDLPVIDLTTAMDFDDAAGVILLGNCRGEISFIQFNDKSLQSTKSLRDDLPQITYDLPQLETSPICTVLPICYQLYEEIHEGSVPVAVCEEATKIWDSASDSPKTEPPTGWSADWKRHSSLQNWVLPFPRWRTLAADQPTHFAEAWNRVIMAGLGHGDIVPIMYKEDDHDFVIFRIARRIYFFLRGPPMDPSGHIICALPYSMDELSNPNLLALLWKDRWRIGRTSPCEFREDGPSTELLYKTMECAMVLTYFKNDAFCRALVDRSLSEDLRTWSLEDRNFLFRMARSLWEANHKSMNHGRMNRSPQDFE